MNFCFISYWGVAEGLTQATVIPHLEILMALEQVDKIQFISMERAVGEAETIEILGVTHHHIKSSELTIDKLTDGKKVSRLINKLHSDTPIDLLIARGVMAGWLSLNSVKKLGIPLSVESFEPHADYMVEDGVWKKNGIRYKVLRNAEIAELGIAVNISTVTQAYKRYLIEHDGCDERKISVVPCCVKHDKYKFNQIHRDEVRKRLGITPERLVAVYTGKLGGIYLEDEAIHIIKEARKYFGADRFRLIILSPDAEKWKSKLEAVGFIANQSFVAFVDQSEVVKYLSAADFAFSLHRPTPSKIGISPIKNSEYLANGLPIIMPFGIGDDSDLITAHNFGVVVREMDQISPEIFDQIERLTSNSRLNGPLDSWAVKNRSFDIVRTNYNNLLTKLNN